MAANGKRRYPPNTRLMWHRLQKGWSRDELVHQIAVSMRAYGEVDTGLTADTARRWESGERWPEARFRKHLVLVFGLPASELGLLTADELALRPEPAEIGAGDQSAGEDLVDALRRWWLMSQEPDGVGRQQFLRALLAAGLTPLAASTALDGTEAVWSPSSMSGRDPRAVASYRTITDTQRRMYWTTPPATLVDAALSHLRLGARMLSSPPTGREQGADLTAAVAEAALLCARLAFFDLGQTTLAERCLDHANAAVKDTGDHALAAAIAAHRAFLPGFAGDRVAAQQHLDVAHAHVRYAGSPTLRAWLHCVTAEIHARTGQAGSARDRIRQAEDALASTGTDPDWLDFFDEARLAGFAGNAELIAGRHDSATEWLTRALHQLDRRDGKQRAVLLFDLATATAPLDATHSAEFAHQACEILETTFYDAAFDRVPGVQRALDGTRPGAELAERVSGLRALAASS